MSSLLDEIVAHTQSEVDRRKERIPVKLLEESIYFQGPTVSLCGYLQREDMQGIIAEIKRRSPSRGDINPHISVENLSIGYMQAGASALSVLTNEKYFGGTLDDLRTARRFNFCPLLRKDFMVDEYQVIEAKSCGADAILLIAAALEPTKVEKLAACARGLGMEVLLEVHSEEEFARSYCSEVSCVGVNSRDLKTFTIDSELPLRLASLLPADCVKVAESGIRVPADVIKLRSHGYQGFLIGEQFMSHSRPEVACERFIKELRNERSASSSASEGVRTL